MHFIFRHFSSSSSMLLYYVGGVRRRFILFFSLVNEIVIYYTLTFIDDTKCEIYMEWQRGGFCFLRGPERRI